MADPIAFVTEPNYLDEGVVNGTEYFYVVRARDAADQVGPVSNEASAIPAVITPEVGNPMFGGFYAGEIYTTQGNIDPADTYQEGERYALIVSPESLESPTQLRWRSSYLQPVDEAKTRWNGLAAQRALAADTAFEAFQYCIQLPFPADDGSEWYLPALDELELIYRNLKPSTAANTVGDTNAAIFPAPPHPNGSNPSSNPPGPPYTASSPVVTSVPHFVNAGGENLTPSFNYLAATWQGGNNVWTQHMGNGQQYSVGQINSTRYVRPVRRVPLT